MSDPFHTGDQDGPSWSTSRSDRWWGRGLELGVGDTGVPCGLEFMEPKDKCEPFMVVPPVKLKGASGSQGVLEVIAGKLMS